MTDIILGSSENGSLQNYDVENALINTVIKRRYSHKLYASSGEDLIGY